MTCFSLGGLVLLLVALITHVSILLSVALTNLSRSLAFFDDLEDIFWARFFLFFAFGKGKKECDQTGITYKT